MPTKTEAVSAGAGHIETASAGAVLASNVSYGSYGVLINKTEEAVTENLNYVNNDIVNRIMVMKMET